MTEQPDLGLVLTPSVYTAPLTSNTYSTSHLMVQRPSLNLMVVLDRLPNRQKCSSCGVRRVLYALAVVGLVQGEARCAKCMGLR